MARIYKSTRALPYVGRRVYAKTTKRARRSKDGGSQASKQLTVFRYPFSTKTVAAKIPDGEVTLSSGQRFQMCESLKIGKPGTPAAGTTPAVEPSNAGWIVLVPHIDQFIWYSGGDISSSTPSGGIGTGSDPMDVDDGTAETFPSATATALTTAEIKAIKDKWKTFTVAGHLKKDTTLGGETRALNLAKWRLVSTGLKISLINNSDNNEGFFESVRVSTGLADSDKDVATMWMALDSFATGAASMINQPSYVTGKLRDIHKFLFQCKPDGMNHGFNKPTDLVDNGFDFVLIRITGRAFTTTDPAMTQVVLHAVSNQELVYQPRSTLSRFHTECQFAKNFSARTHARYVDIKSAVKNVL